MLEDTMEKRVLTVKEFCKAYQISLPTGYQFVHAQGFPAIHVGRKILVSASKVDDWMLEHSREAMR